MNQEQQEIYKEKQRLLLKRVSESLDADIKTIEAEQSAKLALKSGATVKRIRQAVFDQYKRINKDSIENAKSISPTLNSKTKAVISKESEKIQSSFLSRSSEILRQKCGVMGGPKNLYHLIEKDFLGELATIKAEFYADLETYLLSLKSATNKERYLVRLWWIEGILLLFSLGLAVIWFLDPNGNYEPLLVIAGLLIPIILFGGKIKKLKT